MQESTERETTSAETRPLPLVILAGGDPEPPTLPAAGRKLHPLRGIKAAKLRVGRRPLLNVLIERFASSGRFDPIFVAGPANLFAEVPATARVIDTDANFGENLQAAVNGAGREASSAPLALTTSDILPELADLDTVLDDYARHVPVDFWFPVIRAPRHSQALGASAWKPRYSMIPEGEQEPVSILPGHLLVADPGALDLPLIYRSFDLAYRSRNTPILPRLVVLLAGVLGGLLKSDFKRLLRLRPPSRTATVAAHAIGLGLRLRSGKIKQSQMENHTAKIFVPPAHRRRHPGRSRRICALSALSLAKDIDTQEEAAELENLEP